MNLQFFDRALTSEEVLILYHKGLSVKIFPGCLSLQFPEPLQPIQTNRSH